MMLYIGALADLWPVRRYAHAHSEFIYVDGLPKSEFFRPEQAGWQISKDKETMVAHIRADLQTEDALESDEKLQNDVHVFRLRGGATLRYYFNRKDVDIPNDAALKDVLPQVTALYVQGFLPKLPELRSLKKCYYTGLCSDLVVPDTVSTAIVPEVSDDHEDFCYGTRCEYCDEFVEL